MPADRRSGTERPRARAAAPRARSVPELAATASVAQTDIAAAAIRESILDLSLSPGTRLDDKALLGRFGVGRTPAREALNRLVSEGLVEIEHNRGAFVRPLDIETIQQFFDAYAASERLNGFFCRTREPGLAEDLDRHQERYRKVVAARDWLEVTRVNAALHLRIAAATQNQYVIDFATRLQNQARRVSYFIYRMEHDNGRTLEQHQTRVNRDHGDIVATVRRHDNAALVEILTRHVGLFHERIVRVLKATRGLDAPLPVRF